MAVVLEDLNRDYQRIRPSHDEKVELADNGLQWTLSSNISAVGTAGEDLIIRFHNGSLYKYPKNAKHFAPMLKSNSKGKYFWRKLRRPGARYIKIGALPLGSDIDKTDDEVFERIETQGIRVEEPQVLSSRDVLGTIKALAGITLFSNILSFNVIPIKILK
jgi:hypothetical protein